MHHIRGRRNWLASGLVASCVLSGGAFAADRALLIDAIDVEGQASRDAPDRIERPSPQPRRARVFA